MKIQINTEAELDIDAIADALDSDIESKVDAFVDSAIDNYNFYDIVRDQLNDIDLSYEVGSCLDDRDDLIGNDEMVEVESRITDLEETIARLSQALPNTELAKSITANEELQTKYNELETKFKKMAGIEDAGDFISDER
jgi:uncharacterized coiled-coil protein SlyX